LREAFYNTYYRDLAYFIRDQIDAKDISEELFAIFEFGMKLSDNTYTESKHLILQWQNFNRRLSGNPLILSLSTSTSAPKIGEKDSIDANIFITSAGLPQISLPILFDIDNRTVGLSFSSKRFSDKTLLATLSNLFPQDFLESYSGVK
jgi:Asp-tRNA(Asn)/Glu-tRNA(Gln) amidotransferase A subunit family amidase